jgi:transmembrane sensor
MTNDDTIRAQAVNWAVRTGDPAFEDWDSFTLWLAEDPAHAQAYDAICASVNDIADLMSAALPANDYSTVDHADTAPAGVSRRRWLGGALAASLVLFSGWAFWQGNQRDLYRVQTVPGETRTIALDEGGRIDLAGGTVMELDHDDPRFGRLEQGRALFTIRHDDNAPFTLLVGHDRLVDVGTVFEVRRDNSGMSVAVSEGAVQYNPNAQNVLVSPGELLRTSSDGRQHTVSSISPKQVGEWREGRLTFSGSSLHEVATDLTNATGVEFGVAGGAAKAVSGSVLVDPIKEDPRSLGPLLGLEVRAAGERWVIGGK